MKKLIVVLTAVMMSLVAAGPAAAAFDTGNLIGVIYNPSEMEIGIDLGAVSALTPGSTLADNAFTLPGGSEGDWSAAFFALDGDNYYFATTSDTAPSFNARGFASFVTADSIIRPFYDTGNNDPAAPSSYNYKMNANGTVPGQYASLNVDWQAGEVNLADLATMGYVDMYLYAIHKISRSEGELIPSAGQDYQAILRITADGDIAVSPVPVPAAVWLFGSGLLGLIGIRRKNS